MTKPKNARQVGKHRTYQWRKPGTPPDGDAETYFSVTTLIRGGLPAPALIGWGMKSVAEFAVANHRQVTAMLDAVKLTKDDKGFYRVTDPDAVQSAIDFLKGSPYRERDRKADIGSEVHAVAEAYVLGKSMPAITGDAAPYCAQFERFLEEWKPAYELSEASVYNRTFRYAGTLDAIAVLDGFPGIGAQRVLLDYKTNAKDVYPEAALQLAAYRAAEFIGAPDGTEQPMPAVDGAAVVWIRPDGYDVIPVRADAETFKSFRYCMEVFRWAEEISKTVIGQPLPVPAREKVA